jgi:NADH:ubiquinone oxidoreductase subunit E
LATIYKEATMEVEGIVSLVDKHRGERGGLIAILDEVQRKDGYLSRETIEVVADRTGRSLVDVYGVATFYKSFSLEPRGRHVCSVCVGTACHVRGAPAVAAEVTRQLGVEPGETTEDMEFTLLTVNCLGACALGPIVVADNHYFSNVTPSGVKRMIDQTRAGLESGDADAPVFPIEARCPRCNHGLSDRQHPLLGYPSISLLASEGPVQGWLRLSGLYGAYAAQAENGVREGVVVRMFCPHCCGELHGGSLCADCEAPFVPLLVQGGAILQLCSRLGCRGHLLDLSGMNA